MYISISCLIKKVDLMGIKSNWLSVMLVTLIE
jgi:hypothetical protein